MSGNQQVWDKHYAREKSKLSVPDENVVRYLSKYFAARDEGPRVLDLGCGSGRHLAYLSGFDCDSIGQDFAIEALEKLEHNALTCARAGALPYQDHSFDLVVAWGVLHYLGNDELQQCLSELARILKGDGRLFATLRSKKDSHLAEVLEKGDLASGTAQLYSRDEALALFDQFERANYGFIMRQPLGDDNIIAHHMIEAVK